MKVSVEKVDDINYILRGEVPNNTIERKIEELTAKRDAQEPAEASPSDQQIEQEAIGEIFKAFLDAGIEDAGIQIEELLGQPGFRKYEKQDEKLIIEVDIAKSPNVNVDADYSEIVPAYEKPKAGPQEVEEKMREFATRNAPFGPIETPRSVENGDNVLIDFTGYLDGETFEGGSARSFKLKIGSNAFIPGFEAQLIGMAYGEEKTIEVTFPPTYPAEDLAGKPATFVVKLHEIQEQKSPVLDDAFAQQILNDPNATLDTLREKMAEQISAEALTNLYNQELKPKLIEGLLKTYDFPLPNNIVEQEIDARVRQMMQQMSPEEQKAYSEDKERFLALRESLREESADGIKTALIVEALAKKEHIEVDEQEVISALTYQAMMSGQDAEALVRYYRENNLMKSAQLGLTEDKLFGHILGFDKN